MADSWRRGERMRELQLRQRPTAQKRFREHRNRAQAPLPSSYKQHRAAGGGHTVCNGGRLQRSELGNSGIPSAYPSVQYLSSKFRLQSFLTPCYGFRLGPCFSTFYSGPTPRFPKRLTFLRNIFGQKCHEVFGAPVALSSALAIVFACQLAAQGERPATPPPSPESSAVSPSPQPSASAPLPAEQPNAANPNQRLKLQRPDAPGPDDVLVIADTEESDGPMRRLRGHVRLETIDKRLLADEVDYNADTGDAEARGHVQFESFTEGSKLQCDHGKYNVNSETGVFYEVSGTSQPKIVARPGLLTTSNPFYFEGKWAERQEDRYIIHEGFVTDCKVPK